MNRPAMLLFSALLALCASCNRAVLKHAIVDVAKPPNIYGNTSMLEPDLRASVSAELSAPGAKSEIIPLSGDVAVIGKIQREESSISYRLLRDTRGANAAFAKKRENGIYYGGSAGYQNLFYYAATLGLNKKHFDIGFSLLSGFPRQKIKYDGYNIDEDTGDIKDYFDEEMENCPTSYGAYAHASAYIQSFALSYAAAIYSPMQDYIKQGGCDASFMANSALDFRFPELYMHDIGIAYTIKHFRYRIGLNRISSWGFSEKYYGASFQAALLF